MVSRSTCPECGTILRIRDRTFVGRKVNCPECKTALRVEAGTQDGQIGVRRLTAAELVHQEHEHVSAPKGRINQIAVPATVIRSKFISWINSPLMAAWLLAIAVVSLFAIVMLTPRYRLASPRPSVAPVEFETPVESKRVSPPESTNQQDSGSVTERVIVPSQPAPAPASTDQAAAISALQPANVEGPLPWPPVVMSVETVAEPLVPNIPAVKKIDVASKMSQRFPLYKQTTPVSRRLLIEVLEEQLGAPIRYNGDELGNANLDKTITFELENTTIGAVIRSVADAAGWEAAIEPTGLRLKLKEPPDTPRRSDLDK